MRAVRSIAVLPILLAACARETVWIEPPPSAGAASLVVAFTSEGALDLLAVELAGEAGALAAPIAVEVSADASLEALLYRSPLGELGVAAGALEDAGASGRALPPPDATYALRLREGRGAGWSVTAGISEPVAQVRVSASEPRGCAAFDVQVFELETRASVMFALHLGEHEVLLGAEDGTVHRFTPERGAERIEVAPAVKLFAAVRGELGDLWFGSKDGDLYRGDLSDRLRLTRIAASPSGEQLHWFDAGTTEDGLELYSLSIEGAFERFRLGRWVPLARFPAPVPGDHSGGVLRTAPGRAIAVWPKVSAAVIASGDAVRDEPTPAAGGFASISLVPALGLIGGSTEGGFVRFDGSAWVELPGSPFTFAVNAIAAYEDGFLYGGPVGNFGQYSPSQPGSGFCPLAQPAPHWIRHLVVLGEDVFLAGTNDMFPETPVTLLRRRR